MSGSPPSGSLSSSVTGTPDRPVLTLAGELTSSTVNDLLTALAKIIQEHPESIILDMTRLRVTDKIHLASLITIGHRTAAWPGCPVALCVVDERTRDAIRRLGIDRYMPLCCDARQARRRLGELPVAPRLREHLLPTLHSVELARALARDACVQWNVPAIQTNVLSIVTELVVNAVVHTDGPVELTFALSRPFFYVAVRDQSDRLPLRMTDGEDRGYGLTVVDAFASQWGSHRALVGKVVWAAIRVTPRNGRRAATAEQAPA